MLRKQPGSFGILALATALFSGPNAFGADSAETRILQDIKILASDDFGGRAPGSPGEEKTVAYLVKRFRELGLQPGNPNGTFIQEVPLVGSIATEPSISYVTGDKTEQLSFPTDCVIWTKRLVQEISVHDSEMVFVGYGVEAPEYQWDDYKGADVRGKTLVMLINDPPVPDPTDPSRLDDKVFKGKAMTYYGRWTYKYEIAAAKGRRRRHHRPRDRPRRLSLHRCGRQQCPRKL